MSAIAVTFYIVLFFNFALFASTALGFGFRVTDKPNLKFRSLQLVFCASVLLIALRLFKVTPDTFRLFSALCVALISLFLFLWALVTNRQNPLTLAFSQD